MRELCGRRRREPSGWLRDPAKLTGVQSPVSSSSRDISCSLSGFSAISGVREMKVSGIIFASAVAASSAAFTSSDDHQIRLLKPSDEAPSGGNGSSSASQRNLAVDKFAPRFDGLRFIETLITAHR